MNKAKKFLYKGSFGIPDDNINNLLSSINSRKALQFIRNSKTDKDFINTYENWLFSSKNFSINHLDKNKFQPYISLGTTQSFHDFYQIHHDKNLKINRGEYPYHRVFFNSINRKWSWIEDNGIKPGDFVILSYPFCGNGGTGGKVYETLDLCNKYSVPVLLDCAFWGLSVSSSLNLKQYPCIQMISFSLSKFFNVGRLRIGMMYSQYEGKASGAILAPYHYINSWSAYIGIQLLKNFSIDYMNKKYRAVQEFLCQHLDIFPSETLLFGIGKGDEWKDFWRDEKFNRICLSQFIYEKIKNETSELK